MSNNDYLDGLSADEILNGESTDGEGKIWSLSEIDALLSDDAAGRYGSEPEDFSDAAMLLNTRAINVKFMCEPNQHPLDDIQGAFEEAATPGKFRVHVIVTER